MYIVILVTVPSKGKARRIAEDILKKRLAACVNILNNKIDSFFWWKGKIDRAREWLLAIKSKRRNTRQIIKTVKSLHSYDVPEIICLPIIDGYKAYLDWIDESVG
ncbi:MAG: divalent-cation tolerance protein CutA [Candidatus Omnitrophica bacterium]|nr:divalent-cation tolerance protein CutA [Candidatus Omnitrophota bacterium]